MNSPEDLIPRFAVLRDQPIRVTPLGGGLTNRNFQIDTPDRAYVLRIPGQDTALLGIDRACEAECSRVAGELGIGPEVVAYLPDQEILLRRFMEGTVLTEDSLQSRPLLERAVASLRQYHLKGSRSGRFSAVQTILHYHALARDRGVKFPAELAGAMDWVRTVEAGVETGNNACPCHNDLLAANFIYDGSTVRIIDWEYAGMGDPMFDLGNLAANADLTEDLEGVLLQLYFGESAPGRMIRLRRMRRLSEMREALWGYLQSALSTLPIDFVEYGRQHLDRALALKPRR